MSNNVPEKSLGDHVHLAVRTALSAVPAVGGPALELFNALIAPPIERRRNAWLNDLAERLLALEKVKRLKIEDLTDNAEFITAVMQATMAALRNHQQEKIDALRNAVLNTALGQSPEDAKREVFLAFADQFTVWHLRVLNELSNSRLLEGKNGATSIRINEIARLAMERIPGLRGQQPLAETVVEDLCRKGLLYWISDQIVAIPQRGAPHVTQFGGEFLRFISEPQGVASKD
jgi:hypothetical protein